MRIRTPSSYFVYPAAYGGDFRFARFPGMGALGQDDGSEPGPTDIVDTTNVLPSQSDVNSALAAALANETYSSPVSGLTDAQLLAAGNATQAAAVAQDQNLNLYVTGSGAPVSGSGSAQTLTAAAIAIQAAAKGITALSPPYQVPGTSLVYNPATGQVLNAAGAVVGTAALPTVASSLLSYVPLAIGAVVLVILMQSMGGRR